MVFFKTKIIISTFVNKYLTKIINEKIFKFHLWAIKKKKTKTNNKKLATKMKCVDGDNKIVSDIINWSLN